MRWFSTLSKNQNVESNLHESLDQIKSAWGNERIDFLTLFVSPNFEKDYKKIQIFILEHLNPRVLIGCSAAGIIGGGNEIETRPAISISAARMMDVSLRAFKIGDEDLPDLDSSPKSWEKCVGVERSIEPHFLILADPFSIRIENLVSGLDYAYPRSVKVGGLASGAQAPGKNALFLDQELYREGAVGIAFSGNIELDTLVAQGTRPIGKPFQITACEQNLLLGIDGKPPLEALEEIFNTLNPRDQDLIQNSLFLGIAATSTAKINLGPGDFLIRNILAADSKQGSLAIGNLLRIGQTVQFHLRDAQTSHEDLEEVLSKYSSRKGPFSEERISSMGALLFSCVGRGSYLYKAPNHDTNLFHKIVGHLPVTGFFCNGEIGPVGGTTYIHGYTSCFGLFSSKK